MPDNDHHVEAARPPEKAWRRLCRIARPEKALLTADIIVVGGGLPGVCAAVAASRLGARVVLVERDGLLGGQAAEVWTWGVAGFVDRNGQHIMRGIAWEILQRTIAVGGQGDALWTQLDVERMERDGLKKALQDLDLGAFTEATLTPGAYRYLQDQYIDPNALRYVLQVLVAEEGITTLLEAPLTGVLMSRKRLKGVICQGNYGPFAIEGQVVIDTTQQALVAALAGRPFPYPEIYLGTQPRVAGVDVPRLLQYLREHQDDWRLIPQHWWSQIPAGREPGDPDLVAALIAQGRTVVMFGFTEALHKAIAADPAIARLASDAKSAGEELPLTLQYEGDGCASYWVWAQHWRNSTLSDHVQFSQAIAEGRKQQWLVHRIFNRFVPGFEHARLVDVHPHITRALKQAKEPGGFTECDVQWEHIERGDRHMDSVARIMGHPHRGQAAGGWTLPYCSLLPKGLDGLLVTGKPACRFVHMHVTSAAVAQAAGVAAAVALRDGTSLRKVDVSRVQAELQRQGAVVD